MTQRLIIAAGTVLASIILAASPGYAPPNADGPVTSEYRPSFYENTTLDTTQVIDAETQRCAAFYYYEKADTLYCISPDNEWTAE